MKAQDIIRETIKMRETTQAELADRLGYKSQANISVLLTQNKEMKMSVFFRLLTALGYEIVVRDIANREYEWILTMSDASKKE